VALVGAVMHGAAYMTMKADGDLLGRMIKNVSRFWIAFVVLYVIATFLTIFVSPFLFEGTLGNPLFWVLLILFLAAIAYIPVALKAQRFGRVFLSTSVVIATVMGQMVVGMFPKLVPSSLNLANSLTIYNASSTDRTLTVMLIIALIGMPLVIIYSAYMYRVFKGKTVITPESY
jgi:cytochrome d ubiquinol oxidase subunit II